MNDGRGTAFVRCRRCRTIYADPRPAREARRRLMGDDFGLSADALDMAERRTPAMAAEAAAIKALVPSGRLLDVGCGVGALLSHFAGPGWERYGVEVAASAAAYATTAQQSTVHVGTLLDAPFAEHFFDVITFIDVLYYSDDPPRELAAARRLLRPGGVLAIEVSGLSYQVMRSRGPLCLVVDGRWSRLHPDTHSYWFSPAAIFTMLEHAGLTVAGYEVVPSPRSTHAVGRPLRRAHHAVGSFLAARSPRLLSWAPKYLVLAKA
jgi:SAM-dependent methyltransferase